MNRRVLAGMLGLTVAGCAQGRATQTPAGDRMPPVGMQTLPSIHQSISADVRQMHPENRLAMRDADPMEPDPIAALELANEHDPAPSNGSLKQAGRDESTGGTQVAENEQPYYRRPQWRRMPNRPGQAVEDQDSSTQVPIETASAGVTAPRRGAATLAVAPDAVTPTLAQTATPESSGRSTTSSLLDEVPGPLGNDPLPSDPPHAAGLDAAASPSLNQGGDRDQAATPAASEVASADSAPEDSPPPIPDMPPILPVPMDAAAAATAPAPAATAITSPDQRDTDGASESTLAAAPAQNAQEGAQTEPLDDLPLLPGDAIVPEPLPPLPGGASPIELPLATQAQEMPANDLPPLPGEPSQPPATDDADLGESLPPIELPPLPGEIPTLPLPGSGSLSLPGSAAPDGQSPELDLPQLPGEAAPASAAPAGASPPQAQSTSAGDSTTPDALDLAAAAPEAATGSISRKTAPRVPAPEPPPQVDTEVQTVAADPVANDPASMRAKLSSKGPEQAGLIAARVGNDVITLQELQKAVDGRRKGMRLSNEELNMLASRALDDLIDQTLLIQETRRTIKDAKKFAMFKEYVNKLWIDEELPPLLRQFKVQNEYELRQKLDAKHISLDALREEFSKTRMAREFMEMNLRPRMTVDLPEMRDHYNAHLKDFNRPAQITWREVVVELPKHAARGEARRKADALLNRLRHGEDFARLAKAESESPSPDEGGLWKTSPGASVVPAVNDALARLPLNQISSVLEGPSSFHIVRVEGRRESGVARFDEVQTEIRYALLEQKYQREVRELINKLRAGSLISTIFDGSESAPTVTSNSATVPPASTQPD
jgi:parvulin-like peptidyl-prolyl isomerase